MYKYICESLFDDLDVDDIDDISDMDRDDIDYLNGKEYKNTVSFTFSIDKKTLVNKFIDLLKEYNDIINETAKTYNWGYRILTKIREPRNYITTGNHDNKWTISVINYKWEMCSSDPGMYVDIKNHTKDAINNSNCSYFLVDLKWSFDDIIDGYDDVKRLLDEIREMIKLLNNKNKDENIESCFGVLINNELGIRYNQYTLELTEKSLKRIFVYYFGKENAETAYQRYIETLR